MTRYRCILIDPPWPEHGGGKSKRGADRHYPVMTVRQIAALPVGSLAEADAHVWVWATSNYLAAAIDCGRAWGFRFIGCRPWVKAEASSITSPDGLSEVPIWKPQKTGLGRYMRCDAEFLLLFARGQAMVPAFKPRQTIYALLEEETRIEGDLKAVRAALRKNEETRLSLGDELAVFAEQIHTGERKVSIKTTHTLTPGNELVITDARNGREIERRTATREELDLASEKTASMQTLGGKLNPQDELVTVSVDSKAFTGKAGKRLASHMSEVQPDTDDIDAEPYPVAWLQADNSRSAAVVPRWVASRLRTIAGDQAEAIGFSVADRQ